MGDLVLGFILILGIWDGWRRGVIRILGSIGAVVGGIFIARRLTPHILPWIEDQFNWTANPNPFFESLTTLFFSQTPFGRLVELILSLLIIVVVTWCLRILTRFLSSVIDATPLIGFLSSLLGAILAVLVWAVFIFAFHTWILPWLVSLIPELSFISNILNSSVFILPYINEIGYWVWFLAAMSLTTFAQAKSF